MDAPCQTTPPLEIPSRYTTDRSRIREMLDLSAAQLAASDTAQKGFALKVPDAFLQRIRQGDPGDPLLLQVWPSREEELDVPGYHHDPVGDGAATLTPGLLQKYRGRALLVTTGACAIHCRYCFRRHFPYHEHRDEEESWQSALAQIRSDPTLTEIILSGGDPLTLSNRRLASLLAQLGEIPHLKRMRIHTRIPVVMPRRLDEPLGNLLARYASSLVMVVHANHARELDAQVHDTLWELRHNNIVLLNQSVLLRGVNDAADRLIALSERLFECGVLPYYLHQLDPVAGAAHFQVSDETAVALLEAMRCALPGYLVPQLVREQEGEPYKRPIL